MSRLPKYLLSGTMLALAAVLVACGASNASTAAGDAANPQGGNGAPNTQPLALAPEMLVGTFKLEGTANAVDAATATALLPLWQTYKELASNSSASQTEMDSLTDQIKSTMTPSQVDAITAMKLTQQDLFALMQAQGIANFRGSTTGTPRARTGNSGGPGGPEGPGGPPGGGFIGGNGGTNGQGINPQQLATFQAGRANRGPSTRVPSALLDALIKLLQQKAGIVVTPNASEAPPPGPMDTPAMTNTPAAPASS
jgi:hypothetical protein